MDHVSPVACRRSGAGNTPGSRRSGRFPRPRPHLACIVADLRQARIALDAAQAAGATVELWSPPDGAASLGVGFWAALDRAVAAAAEPGRAKTVLDCGDAPGYALAALREGLRSIHVAGAAAARPAVRDRLAAIAQACNAELHPGPPPALDLRDRLDPAASCRHALRDSGVGPG